jgi:hypothetical protein
MVVFIHVIIDSYVRVGYILSMNIDSMVASFAS